MDEELGVAGQAAVLKEALVTVSTENACIEAIAQSNKTETLQTVQEDREGAISSDRVQDEPNAALASGGGRQKFPSNRVAYLQSASFSLNGASSRSRSHNGMSAAALANFGRRPGKASKYKGVSYEKTTNRWKARLYLSSGHQAHIGYFKGTPEGEIQAAKSHDAAVLMTFGFVAARLNFPEEVPPEIRLQGAKQHELNGDALFAKVKGELRAEAANHSAGAGANGSDDAAAAKMLLAVRACPPSQAKGQADGGSPEEPASGQQVAANSSHSVPGMPNLPGLRHSARTSSGTLLPSASSKVPSLRGQDHRPPSPYSKRHRELSDATHHHCGSDLDSAASGDVCNGARGSVKAAKDGRGSTDGSARRRASDALGNQASKGSSDGAEYKSRYLGVEAGQGCWQASINLPGKGIVDLGSWPMTKEGELQAARQYDEAARSQNGKDTQTLELNFPNTTDSGSGFSQDWAMAMAAPPAKKQRADGDAPYALGSFQPQEAIALAAREAAASAMAGIESGGAGGLGSASSYPSMGAKSLPDSPGGHAWMPDDPARCRQHPGVAPRVSTTAAEGEEEEGEPGAAQPRHSAAGERGLPVPLGLTRAGLTKKEELGLDVDPVHIVPSDIDVDKIDPNCSFRGVDKLKDKWRARIHLPGRGQVHLGYFDGTPTGKIQAAMAVDQAVKRYFGHDPQRLNFIDGEFNNERLKLKRVRRSTGQGAQRASSSNDGTEPDGGLSGDGELEVEGEGMATSPGTKSQRCKPTRAAATGGLWQEDPLLMHSAHGIGPAGQEARAHGSDDGQYCLAPGAVYASQALAPDALRRQSAPAGFLMPSTMLTSVDPATGMSIVMPAGTLMGGVASVPGVPPVTAALSDVGPLMTSDHTSTSLVLPPACTSSTDSSMCSQALRGIEYMYDRIVRLESECAALRSRVDPGDAPEAGPKAAAAATAEGEGGGKPPPPRGSRPPPAEHDAAAAAGAPAQLAAEGGAAAEEGEQAAGALPECLASYSVDEVEEMKQQALQVTVLKKQNEELHRQLQALKQHTEQQREQLKFLEQRVGVSTQVAGKPA